MMIYPTTPRGKQALTVSRNDDDVYKVFFYKKLKKSDNPLDLKWGRHEDAPTVGEASIIQNICAYHGLAPMVKAVALGDLGRKYYATQIIEKTHKFPTSTEEVKEVFDKVIELGKQYGFELITYDCSPQDIMDGMLIDFQQFRFTEDPKEIIAKFYKEATKWGKIQYQGIKALKVNDGPRHMETRIKEQKLEDIDFKGKTVIDIGCSGGEFTRYAKDQGANSVTGFDFRKDLLGASIASIYLGYSDIEYKDKIDWDFSKIDVCFYLSMNRHIGWPWEKITHMPKMLVFERNKMASGHEIPEEEVVKNLEKHFSNVEELGTGSDHGFKPIYHCTR